MLESHDGYKVNDWPVIRDGIRCFIAIAIILITIIVWGS